MTVLRGISAVGLLLLLGACANNPGAACPRTSDGKLLFRPLTYSRANDTRPTVRGIVGHNAAGKSVCGKEWKL